MGFTISKGNTVGIRSRYSFTSLTANGSTFSLPKDDENIRLYATSEWVTAIVNCCDRLLDLQRVNGGENYDTLRVFTQSLLAGADITNTAWQNIKNQFWPVTITQSISSKTPEDDVWK